MHRSRRASGLGSLYLNRGVWFVRLIRNGKVLTRSLKTGDPEVAKQRSLAALASFGSDRIDGEDVISVASLGEYYRDAPSRRQCSDRQLRAVLGAWDTFARSMEAQGARLVSDLTPTMVAAYFAGLDVAAATHLRIVNACRRVYRLTGHLHGGSPYLFGEVAPRRRDGNRRRELSEAEVGRVLEVATGEWRTLVMLGLYTGLRLGDCATFRPGCIDRSRGVMLVKPLKTANTSGRTVAIPLHPALDRHLSGLPGDPSGYAVPTIAAMWMRDSAAVSKRTRKIFTDAGIEVWGGKTHGRHRVLVGFHSLRHTFVSICLNAGAPLAVIQSIVGHGNPVVTERYYHGSDDAARRAVMAIPDLASGGPRRENRGQA